MRVVMQLAALLLTSGAASAQDLVVYGGAELEFRHGEDGPGTNSYGSAYVEADVSGFYAGVWAQLASNTVSDEVNLYLGYRSATAGELSYDIGYTRYVYPNAGGDCCGEVTFGLGVPMGERLSSTLDLAYDPQARIGNAYVGLAWTATDALELSANYGVYGVEGAGSEDEWDLGATYALGDETAIDLRYYDGSDYVDGYVGFSLTWDSTLLGG